MRENIGMFKAQRINSVEWVTGLLTIMWGQYHIINPNDENTAYPIKTETLCEFTGLTDKNGNRIFEGDIVQTEYNGIFYKDYVVFGKIGYDYQNNGLTGFALSKQYEDMSNCYIIEYGNDFSKCEVIGNKFDNPELLEVRDE